MNYLDDLIRASYLKTRDSERQGRWASLLVVAVFGLGGLGMFYGIYLKPQMKAWSAQEWKQVEGEILDIRLESSGDGGRQIAASYLYTYQGDEYEGGSFSFDDTGRNFGIELMREQISGYSTYKRCSVWVNPENPEEAVLSRTLDWTVHLGLVFSLPFLGAGFIAGGWLLLGRTIIKKRQALRSVAARDAEDSGAHEVAQKLREGDSETYDQKLLFFRGLDHFQGLGYLLGALFWNGVVSVFLFVVVIMWQAGEGISYLLGLFLIPFVMSGIFLIWQSGKSFFGRRIPDFVLAASPVTPVEEEMPIDLCWAFLGNERELSEIRKMHFHLRRCQQGAFFKQKKKSLGDGEPMLLISSTEKVLIGQTQLVMEPVKRRKFASFSNFQGKIDLVIQLQWRDGQSQEIVYTVGETETED